MLIKKNENIVYNLYIETMEQVLNKVSCIDNISSCLTEDTKLHYFKNFLEYNEDFKENEIKYLNDIKYFNLLCMLYILDNFNKSEIKNEEIDNFIEFITYEYDHNNIGLFDEI